MPASLLPLSFQLKCFFFYEDLKNFLDTIHFFLLCIPSYYSIVLYLLVFLPTQTMSSLRMRTKPFNFVSPSPRTVPDTEFDKGLTNKILNNERVIDLLTFISKRHPKNFCLEKTYDEFPFFQSIEYVIVYFLKNTPYWIWGILLFQKWKIALRFKCCFQWEIETLVDRTRDNCNSGRKSWVPWKRFMILRVEKKTGVLLAS